MQSSGCKKKASVSGERNQWKKNDGTHTPHKLHMCRVGVEGGSFHGGRKGAVKGFLFENLKGNSMCTVPIL